ncbi:hypothetical protein J437_LFUL015929, partial [Ladona fulva]
MRSVFVQHPSVAAHEDYLNEITRLQYSASCSIDGKHINTFDNKTYPARLGKCWHAAMVTRPQDDDSSSSSSSPEYDDIAVLARELDGKKKEIKVVLGDKIFEIKPTGSSASEESGSAQGYVVYNQTPLHLSHRDVTEIEDEEGTPIAYAYTLPSGDVVFEAPQHGVFLMYNGYGANIMANSTYRGDILGLCGTYDGEYSTDFTTPRNCIVQNATDFVASYAITDQTCQGEAKEMQRR